MSQTDRNVAIEPAHTVSKADGAVYQVLELNTRQSQTHTRTHRSWILDICAEPVRFVSKFFSRLAVYLSSVTADEN